jgi:Sporulation protein YtfJ (Spore_YtfJ)
VDFACAIVGAEAEHGTRSCHPARTDTGRRCCDAITASARTVYGEPVHSHERTIIPVAKFGYGLGASSGGRNGENVGGGGGGGGVGAKPAGYIEITDQGTRYVAISTPRQLLVALAAGIAAGYLLARLSR